MAGTPIVEGFSLSHAAILDGSTGAEHVDGDIYGIRSGSLEMDSDSYDNTGDDAILSTWYWANRVNITVQSGYIPLKTLALITGSAVETTAGTLPEDPETYEFPLWEQRQMNIQTRPMLIRVPSKDSSGLVRTLDFVLYKVAFQPFSFEGPTYKDGLLLNYGGTALFSDRDEKGDPVVDSQTGDPTTAIGRLLSKPV